MQALDGARHTHGPVARRAEQGRGLQHEEGPQPLAARLDGVAHGFLHPAVEAVRLGQESVQGLVDLGRRLANGLSEAQAKGPERARSCSGITDAMGSRLVASGPGDGRIAPLPDSIQDSATEYAGMVVSGKTLVHCGAATPGIRRKPPGSSQRAY